MLFNTNIPRNVTWAGLVFMEGSVMSDQVLLLSQNNTSPLNIPEIRRNKLEQGINVLSRFFFYINYINTINTHL